MDCTYTDGCTSRATGYYTRNDGDRVYMCQWCRDDHPLLDQFCTPLEDEPTITHYHVVNRPGFHPANVWHKLDNGLVELAGSAYSIPDEHLEGCSLTH